MMTGQLFHLRGDKEQLSSENVPSVPFCLRIPKPNKTFMFGIEITFKCHIQFSAASHTAEEQSIIKRIFRGFPPKKTTYYQIKCQCILFYKTNHRYSVLKTIFRQFLFAIVVSYVLPFCAYAQRSTLFLEKMACDFSALIYFVGLFSTSV